MGKNSIAKEKHIKRNQLKEKTEPRPSLSLNQFLFM
jgi:hypothetical protein